MDFDETFLFYKRNAPYKNIVYWLFHLFDFAHIFQLRIGAIEHPTTERKTARNQAIQST